MASLYTGRLTNYFLLDFFWSLGLVICFSFFGNNGIIHSQSLSEDIVPPSAIHSIRIEDDKLVGEGLPYLLRKIDSSQFFLLGELHGSKELSQFTEALLEPLSKSGFNHLALEIGPSTTNHLITLINEQESLIEFNSAFYKEFNEFPIPFMEGIEDEKFLKRALGKGFEIWGLDQEFLSAPLFLIEDIFALLDENEMTRNSYELAKIELQEAFVKYQNNSTHPYYKIILESNVIHDFFDKANSHFKAKKIIDDILISAEIYQLNKAKQYNLSNSKRLKNFKRNFGKIYMNSRQKGEEPKVFVKMGSNHLTYGKNGQGLLDIGTSIRELSYLNGTKTFSITHLNRFWVEEDNTITDWMQTEGGSQLKPFLEHSNQKEWRLIDLSQVIKNINKNDLKISDEVRGVLLGYDAVLLSPLQSEVTKNLKP